MIITNRDENFIKKGAKCEKFEKSAFKSFFFLVIIGFFEC